MSKLWKTIVSILSVVVVGVAGILLYIYWPAIKGTINSNKYYTAEDLQDSYDKGFDDGNKSETELSAEITYYKNLVDEYEVEVASLNKELNDLTTKKLQNEENIASLTAIKNENEKTIINLSKIIEDNNSQINILNSNIENLNVEKENLEKQLESSNNNVDALRNQINTLNNQISNYQTMINQLQTANNSNIATIDSLNTQVINLNNQISELTLQLGDNGTAVSNLNKRIAKLEESILYYEQYIESIENEQQIVVTFEFDDGVYNIQVINKGSTISIVSPTSTDKVIFNYWTINNERIDLSTYIFTTTTKVIANVTYKNKVDFLVDGTAINTQYIENNDYATLPTNPSKTGYEFDGWTTNGSTVIDVENTQIVNDTIFIAKFTRLYNVNFIYEDEIISTQIIRNGNLAQNISVNDTIYKIFNGWKTNGTYVDISSYKIVSDTVFVADIIYKYDVVFMVDGMEYNSQIVIMNQYATVPTNPTKEGYVFKGWSIDNINIIDVFNEPVISNVTYYAVFKLDNSGLYDASGIRTMTWDEIVANNYVTVSDDGVLSQGTNADRQTNLVGKLVISENIKSIADSTGYGSSGAFYQCTNLTEVVFPETVKYIGKYAFYECSNLAKADFGKVEKIGIQVFWKTALVEIELPNTLTEIGADAFRGCTSLTSVIFPESLKIIGNNAFAGDTSLVSVVMNAGLKSSGSGIFNRCSSLESIIMTNSISKYQSSYFGDCSSLKNVVYLGTLKEWLETDFGSYESNPYRYAQSINIGGKDYVFDDSFEIPQYLEKLGTYSLAYSTFTSATIPSNINKIGYGVFYHCNNLTTLNIPKSVKSFGSKNFYYCYNLKNVNYEGDLADWVQIDFGEDGNPYRRSKSINCNGSVIDFTGTLVIPNGVTRIGSYVFNWTEELDEVVLPNTITEIGEYAFYYSDITKLHIPSSVLTIKKNAFEACKDLLEVTIDYGLQTIEEDAFSWCTNLTSFTMPDSVVTVEDGVFNNSFKLANVKLSNSLTSLAVGVLKDTDIEHIYIPASVTYIDYSAFASCDKLTTIFIPKTVKTIIGKATYGAFSSCSTDLVIYCEYKSNLLPTTYGNGWNCVKGNTLTTKYGYTYSDYLSETGAVE